MCIIDILGDQITTSTTETDFNSDDDKENRHKKSRVTTLNDKLEHKRRHRKVRFIFCTAKFHC
jgi:hypothetical protein